MTGRPVFEPRTVVFAGAALAVFVEGAALVEVEAAAAFVEVAPLVEVAAFVEVAAAAFAVPATARFPPLVVLLATIASPLLLALRKP